jgi:hypothetical protein
MLHNSSKIFQYLTFILLAVVVALIFFWPKPNEQVSRDFEHKLLIKDKDTQISSLRLQNQSLLNYLKEIDSIRLAEKEGYKRKEMRLLKKISAINTQKSTAKDLDSLLTVLYGK